MGRCYAEMAKPDAAKGIEYLNKFLVKQAIVGKPKLIPDDYVYRGKCYAKLGNDSLAILDYQAGLKLDSNRRDLYKDIAESYWKQKKYDQAAINYKKRIDSNPAKASAADWLAYGRSLFLIKDYANADSAFKKIITDDPKIALGWYWRGRCNASLDPDIKSDSARKYYETYWDLAIGEKEKNKRELALTAQYLAGYHMVKSNFGCSKAYFLFALELDPTLTAVKTQLETDKDIKGATAAEIGTCRMPK
jgi:tetratricopeptide (TPR) repeat protein